MFLLLNLSLDMFGGVVVILSKSLHAGFEVYLSIIETMFE